VTQPSYVPISEADQMRGALRLAVPRRWSQYRPAEIRSAEPPRGRLTGAPGPDQGYAMLLAERFREKLRLASGEDGHDVLLGAALVAARRASRLGRAPVAKDIEAALSLFGFLSEAPEDLVSWRRPLFAGLAHDYAAQRRLVELVRDEALLVDPAEARDRLASSWREMFLVEQAGTGEAASQEAEKGS